MDLFYIHTSFVLQILERRESFIICKQIQNMIVKIKAI